MEDYLEGKLDFPGRFAVERHAKQCYACDKDLSAALRLRQMAGDLKRVAAPADFEVALLARIREEKSHRGFRLFQDVWRRSFEGFSWRVAAVTAAVAVMAASAATYLYFVPVMVQNEVRQAVLGEAPEITAAGATGANATAANSDNTPFNQTSGLAVANFSRFAQDNLATPYADPRDFDFFELLVPVAGDRQLILQVPKTIRMRYHQLPREYFIRNVSH